MEKPRAKRVGPVRTVDLDPADWDAYRRVCHEMLDAAIDFVRDARRRPVWRPVPQSVKDALAEPVPYEAQGTEKACEDLLAQVVPYATGNIHPRFFGWVHGGGMAGGLIAEMWAAAMNANLGGRDHGAIYVERQVIRWFAEVFGLPAETSGLLVSGTSAATLIALAAARTQALDFDVGRRGLQGPGPKLVAYTSSEAHLSVAKALALVGVGSENVRLIAVEERFRMDVDGLRERIAEDRQAGHRPFCVIATAGTVNTGAVDDLAAIADVCEAEGLWLHVDGAFGALAVLCDRFRPALAGLERADSIAFDFHKWMQVPYAVGCVLVRDEEVHRRTFCVRQPYVASAARGLSAGVPWFADYGFELSRGFLGLKVWFAIKEHGLRKHAAVIEKCCELAQYLGRRVGETESVKVMAPVSLNIVCLRFSPRGYSEEELDRINEEMVVELQESGVAAPSTTRLSGRLVIRVCICNHRTEAGDLDELVRAIVAVGERFA